LFAQVQQLLALDKEFVLKYKDTDGDLITLTSNEELACALNYSNGDLLRLVVVLKDNVSVTSDSDVPVCGFPCAMHGRTMAISTVDTVGKISMAGMVITVGNISMVIMVAMVISMGDTVGNTCTVAGDRRCSKRD
jgi:hypothetical protein